LGMVRSIWRPSIGNDRDALEEEGVAGAEAQKANGVAGFGVEGLEADLGFLILRDWGLMMSAWAIEPPWG